MKVAVCCIGRQENRYVIEYVNHYLSIGVDKIYIYDNNYDGEEHFEDVLGEYINNNCVEIINYRNMSLCQLKAYQDCYDNYSNYYDWMLFIDMDEYLYMEGFNNIKDFLSQEKFNEFNMIHINWLCHGDNNLVRYENKPLKERFINPILPIDFKKKNIMFSQNMHIKSIIRCNYDKILWNATPHTPSNDIRCCDANGKQCFSQSPFNHMDFSSAYFKHYSTKTIEEWLTIKSKRGYPDGNKDFFKKNNPIDAFFEENEVTQEKIDFLRENGYIS